MRLIYVESMPELSHQFMHHVLAQRGQHLKDEYTKTVRDTASSEVVVHITCCAICGCSGSMCG